LHLTNEFDEMANRFGTGWREQIREAWLDHIGAEDVVLLPGDISWAKTWTHFQPDLDFIATLPGTKVLSRGNHDHYWKSKAKMEELLPAGVIALEQSSVEIADHVIVGIKGWLTPDHRFYDSQVDEKYYQRERGRLERTLEDISPSQRPIIAMTHFPPCAQPAEVGFRDLLQQYKVTHSVYGHLHGGDWVNRTEGLHKTVRYHLVSADFLQFKPKIIVA